MNETAIVTGAGGWLGTRMTRVLREGLPDVPAFAQPDRRVVRCLAASDDEAARLRAMNLDLEIARGDLTDPASLEPLFADAAGATVFHVAGVVHPTRGVKEILAVNVEGTRNVFRAARRAGVRRVVAISSNSPIGLNPSRDHVFDETSPYNPYMTYGRSKMLMERLVAEERARGGIETVVLRPPWFYGPDQPPRQTLFFRMIREGKVPIVGDGNNLRSMAYVDNTCQGMLLAERVAAADGETYWIADRRPYSMNEIVDTIERLMETEFGIACARKRMRLPGIASEVALGLDRALQSLGLYNQKIHVLSEMNKTIACSVAKAERELGYDPKIALEEGMRRSLRWCLEAGHAI